MFSRLLSINDLEQFSQVSSTAYIHNAAETTFEESKDIFGTFNDDGILISQIECGYKTCVYGESELKCAAVGGIASRPEYRRSGGVRKTFGAVFENALEKGCAVSLLYPFSVQYYNKFGYETILKYYNVKCAFRALEPLERYSDVTLATEEHKEELLSVYEKTAKKCNMIFRRDTEDGFCLTPYNSMKYCYFINDSEGCGYVTVSPDRAARTITVNEMLFSSKEALKRLLGFLRIYDGNYDFIIFEKLPLNTPLFNFIDDSNRLVSRTVLEGGAGRILDLEAVLKANSYPSEKGSFSVKMTDAQIERNNGIFTVNYENGSCEILKNATDEYDIAVDTLSAAKIFLSGEGYTRDEIAYFKNIEVKNDLTALIKAFPRRTTIFYDGF